MSLLLLIVYRDGDAAATSTCTFTYDVTAGSTYDVDEAFSYTVDQDATYDPCADE